MITVVDCFLAVNEQGAEMAEEGDKTISGDTDDVDIWAEDAEYTVARSKEVGDSSSPAQEFMAIGQYYSVYYCSVVRTYLYFDTSIIPSGAVITKAILDLCSFYNDFDYNFDIVIQSGMPDYPHKPSQLSDFNMVNYSGNGGQINTDGWAEEAHKEIEINEQGRNWINKGGLTKFVLRSGNDINNIAPTGSEAIYVYSQNCSEESKRPILYIEYSVVGKKQETYIKIDGSLHVNENDDNFFGKIVDCDLTIKRDLVNACLGIVSLSVAITDATKADPCVITAMAHGLSTGDQVKITNVGGMIELNDNLYKITVLTVDTFSLDGVDSTEYTAYTSGGVGTIGRPGGEIKQNIRLKVVVDDIDVSSALVGQVMIQHNENVISLFSFNLNDFQYSPLLVGDYEDKEVVITSYINGQEVKSFTGLIDGTRSDASGKYNLYIYGSGYGKKLLKRMTLISVQEAAVDKTRGAIIKYLADQAGITNIEVPIGSTTVIDHSFQDQFIWDMIQKEMMIEGWVIRFDENGKMLVYEKVIKVDESLYPIPDWEYGEDKFILLGLDTTREGIINQITILGAIFEEEVITINEIDVPPYETVYDEQTTTINKSFSFGEIVTKWVYDGANFKVTAKYLGFTKPPGFIFPKYQDYSFKVTKLNADLTVQGMEFTVTGGAGKYYEGKTGFSIHREIESTLEWKFTEKAFSVKIAIKTKEQIDGGKEQYEEENPNEEVISEIVYTQIKATVNDPDSIAKYGERKPNEEGTEEYPLAETEAQCVDIGQRRIRDSHRYIKQPDYSVNFNPKIISGETVELIDKKIGYNERWYIEEIVHYFDIDPETGAIKPRTRIGCVFYA